MDSFGYVEARKCCVNRAGRVLFTAGSYLTRGDKPLTEPLTEISPMQWDMILRRMSEGRCVPFLGAAVNVRSRDETYPYAGLPLAEKVALDLVNKLMALDAKDLRELVDVKPHDAFKMPGRQNRQDLLRVTLNNLARVALHVDVESNFDFGYLLDLLQTSLSGENTPSKLLETIACVKTLALIVTTNYDRLMESALEKVHRPYERYVQPNDPVIVSAQEKVKARLLQARTQARLILYKIHGSFPDAQSAAGDEGLEVLAEKGDEEGGGDADTASPQPSRIIITEDDYIKLLTFIGKKGEGVPNLIWDFMTDGTLLFLGYSLEDWDFRTIYKGLIEALPPNARRTSFAIQKDPPHFWVEYWKRKGVVICDMDVYRFADELKKRCQERGLYRESWAPDAGGE